MRTLAPNARIYTHTSTKGSNRNWNSWLITQIAQPLALATAQFYFFLSQEVATGSAPPLSIGVSRSVVI